VEFLRVLAPLAENHHLVVPSLPGFGFSEPTPDGGWTPERMARAVAELVVVDFGDSPMSAIGVGPRSPVCLPFTAFPVSSPRR